MKHPLLAVALVYSAGILIADLPSRLPSVFLLFAGCIVLTLATLFWNKTRPALIWAVLFAVGFTNLAQQKAVLAPEDLRVMLEDRAEIVLVRGTLVETPYHRVYEHREEVSWRTIGRLDVEAIRTKREGWRGASGRVTVSTSGILPPDFFGGRTVEVDGVIRPPRGAVAEGVFDYRSFLARQGIYYQVQVDSTNDWYLVKEAGETMTPPIADRFGDWAKDALARGLPVEDQPLQLLWAMTLGWKTAFSGEVAEPFMRSGTMHVFAISGLHIALIAGLLVAVLKVFRVPRAWCPWIVIPLIWFYTGVTGWQASAIRSTIMMTVIIGGWSLKRPSNLLNSLAGAAFIILLLDPQQIFQAGFQLSFIVVFSLALIVPVFDSLHTPLIDPLPDQPSPMVQGVADRLIKLFPVLTLCFPDPLLPKQLRPRWQRIFLKGTRYLFNASATSLAAWLGSIPVIAYYFHLLTPVSLLANLVVVPLSSVALACNLASMTVGSVVPFAGELFNHAAWWFMLLMIRISEWAAQLPGACVHIGTPSPAVFVLYYAALISVVTGWLFKPRHRAWVCTVIVLIGFVTLWEWREQRSSAHLTMLPLNGGEAAYFKPAYGGRDLLIDCGDESAAEFVLKPFLRGQGVDHPSTLLLTHGDVHNAGGSALIHERFPPVEVLVSSTQFRSTAYRDAMRGFEAKPGLLRRVQRGERIGPWTVLHPSAGDRFPQADDNAIVLHGVIEGVEVLLLSDLGKPGQNALLAAYPDLKADIVVSGLPTQGEPLADALLAALHPALIIVTDSEYPASQRASAKLRTRLEASGVAVCYTHQVGAVSLSFKEGKWSMISMQGERQSGGAAQ